MKVKVLVKFKDKYTGEIYEAGEEMTVTKERYEEILSVGNFVEAIEEAPKKKATKKKKTEDK